MENLPLQGLQKKYVCNNDGSQGLALFNAFVGGQEPIANNQNPSQNYNPSPVPNQPFFFRKPDYEAGDIQTNSGSRLLLRSIG